MARAQAETLRPLSDLSTHGNDVVRQARKTGRPVMLTQRGRGVAVVLSLRSFENLRAAAARSGLRRAVHAADRDIANDRFVDHATVSKKLQRWAKGER